jgi:uncharacterized protein DUF1761
MSFDALNDVNWLAIIVATLAYWILGAIWYAPPVFGRAWRRASGNVAQEGVRPGPALYIGTLLANFVMVVATGALAVATGSTEVSDAIVLGVVVGVGYAVALLLLGAVTETHPSPGAWFTINAAYHLIGLVGVALIVTLWD